MTYLLTFLNNDWPNPVVARERIFSILASSILYSSINCLMYAEGYSYKLICLALCVTKLVVSYFSQQPRR